MFFDERTKNGWNTSLYKYLLVGICQNKRNMSMSRNIDSLE